MRWDAEIHGYIWFAICKAAPLNGPRARCRRNELQEEFPMAETNNATPYTLQYQTEN